MPRYLFQGTADSAGHNGPTLQRLQDRALFNRGKANTLETLFDVASPLGMYSGEAHGRLGLPGISIAEKQLLKKAIEGKASPQQILKDFNLFYDGKNWSRYTPDELSDLSNFFAKKNKYGRLEDYAGPSSLSLGDVIKNTPESYRNIPVGLKDLGMGKGGIAYPGSNPAIDINVRNGRNMREIADTIGHEGQHITEPMGRSQGANPDDIPKYLLDRAQKTVGREVSPLEMYYHNRGEIRAEGNSFLNRDADSFTNLADLFANKPHRFDERLLWGE
jgi:hypothetical protein